MRVKHENKASKCVMLVRLNKSTSSWFYFFSLSIFRLMEGSVVQSRDNVNCLRIATYQLLWVNSDTVEPHTDAHSLPHSESIKVGKFMA